LWTRLVVSRLLLWQQMANSFQFPE
jgi:hypothetical protein